jgi:SAM-dependent methyltransferase
MDWYTAYATQVVLVISGIFLIAIASMFLSRRWGAPWIISDDQTVARMLSLAHLEEGDLVVDLGSGDGRILIQAVKNYPVSGLGFEIDPLRYLLSKFFIWRRGLSKRINIRWGDIFAADFSQADAVVMYMTRESNTRLRSLFEQQLNAGVRVVCNAFPIPGWVPVEIDNINLIFVYQVGKSGDEVITQFV